MPLYIEKKWRFGGVTPIPNRLTDRQTCKDRATELLISIRVELSSRNFLQK